MQHLATFEAQFMTKLRNTETELKKNVVYKKACIYNRFPAEHHLGPPYDCFILHIFQNTSVWRSHVVMYESLWLTNFGKIISFR